MDLWADALTFAEKQKADANIEEYTVQLFTPTGGAIPAGILTYWGSEEQVLALLADEERTRIAQRANLLLEGFAEARTMRGEAVMEGVNEYSEIIDSLDR
ncbi:MAG: hypothetical protein DCC48_04140 [Acidobacteria bacterium]|nr:MAG: hypothetical protein DCC48_04140 [Acidobacteriota bacterium]